MLNLWFGSLELPFGRFYKTQIAPLVTSTLTNLWPWGGYNSDFYFTFTEPYFEEDIPEFANHTMSFLFKYTNDNNPFEKAITTPLTVVDALAKIGGYFAIFGLLRMFLFMYNKKSFEKSLQRRYKTLIEQANEGKPVAPEIFQKKLDADDVDQELIKETLSYEMMMTLAIFYNHMLLKEQDKEKDMLINQSLSPKQRDVSRKASTKNRGNSAAGSYQDDDFKTSRDYGAGNPDYDNNNTEIERLPPIPEGAERIATQGSHRSIQRDTLLEEEIKQLTE